MLHRRIVLNTVFHPTLGDPKKTTLNGHISEVCTLAKQNRLGQVIHVAHRDAGLVISGVADRMPDRMDRLVYIDSVLPENGKSLYGIMETHGQKHQENPRRLNEERVSRSGRESIRQGSRERPARSLGHYELYAVHACMITAPAEAAKTLMAGDGRSP